MLRLKDLREITPDLIDRLPKGLAIHCSLDVPEADVDSYTELLGELMENASFEVKCKWKDENKNVYHVDLLDVETKKSFLEMFRY